MSNGQSQPPATPITCDQVSWIMGALRELGNVSQVGGSSIHRFKEGMQIACFVELMEILNFSIDDSGRHNVLTHNFPELLSEQHQQAGATIAKATGTAGNN